MSLLAGCLVQAAIVLPAAPARPAAPNILLITADDMNCDTPGVFGGRVAEITPNLDRLAREGLRFMRAHVAVAVCQPSRECLMTGRYPHRNGAVGFYPIRPDVPTLMESLKGAGYRLGILGKVIHLKPDEKFPWDFKHDQGELGDGRDPEIYRRYTAEFLSQARAAGRPFFLMANSHDPHRPWAGSEAEKNQGSKKKKAVSPESEGTTGAKYPAPSRTYRPEEIAVPGFLPDIAGVRAEMAEYYSSARRCDDTVGAVLRALGDSGLGDSTLVMFLSDNGISQPFAKSNCYLASTRTPWIVRWPGRVQAGSVDSEHFISGIDFMPTILEAAGIAAPPGMDGRSFLPLLSGLKQNGRDRVFTCYNETSARKALPMRCMQTRQFGYIFNGWADGMTTYASEAHGGAAFRAMKAASASDPAVAARVEMAVRRPSEELYDFEADPDALRNLANDPRHRARLDAMRAQMRAWMVQTQDPLLATFDARTASASRGN